MDVAKKHSFASVLSNFELKSYLGTRKTDEAIGPQSPGEAAESHSRRGSISSSSIDTFYTIDDDEPFSDHEDHREDDSQPQTPRPGSRSSEQEDQAHNAEDGDVRFRDETPRPVYQRVDSSSSESKAPTKEAPTRSTEEEFVRYREATPRPEYKRIETSSSDSTAFTNAEEHLNVHHENAASQGALQDGADDGITEEELRELEDELSPVTSFKSRKVKALLGQDPTETSANGSSASQGRPKAKDFADIMLGEEDDRVVDRLFGAGEMEDQSYTRPKSYIGDVRRKIEWRATTSSSKQKEEDKRTFAKLILGDVTAADPLAEKIFGSHPDGREGEAIPSSPHSSNPSKHERARVSKDTADIADLITNNKSGRLADALFGGGELKDQSYDPSAARRTGPRPSRSKSTSMPAEGMERQLPSEPSPSSQETHIASNDQNLKRMTMPAQRSRTRPGSPNGELKTNGRLDFADIVLGKDDAELDKLFGGGKLADQSFDPALSRRVTVIKHSASPGGIPPHTSPVPTQRHAAAASSKQRVSRPASPSNEDDGRPKTAGSMSSQSTARPEGSRKSHDLSKRFTISGPISSAKISALPDGLQAPPLPSAPLPLPDRRKAGAKFVNVNEALSSNPPNIRSMVRTPPAQGKIEQPSVQRDSQLLIQSPTTPQQPRRSPPPPPPQQRPPSPPAVVNEEDSQRMSTDGSLSEMSSVTHASSNTGPESMEDFSHLMHQENSVDPEVEEAGYGRDVSMKHGTGTQDEEDASDDYGSQFTPRAVKSAVETTSGSPTSRHKPTVSVDSTATTDTTTTESTMATTTTADESMAYEDESNASEISARDLSDPAPRISVSPREVPLLGAGGTSTALLRPPPRTSSLMPRTASFDSVAPPPIPMGRVERTQRAGSVGSGSFSGSRLSGRWSGLRQSLLFHRWGASRQWEAEPVPAEQARREEEELLAHSVPYDQAQRGRAPFLNKAVAEIYPVDKHGQGGTGADAARRSGAGAGLLGFGSRGKGKGEGGMKRGNRPIGLEVMREYAVNEALERQGIKVHGDGSSGRPSADSRGSADLWLDADEDEDVYRTPPLSARSAKRLSVLLEE